MRGGRRRWPGDQEDGPEDASGRVVGVSEFRTNRGLISACNFCANFLLSFIIIH